MMIIIVGKIYFKFLPLLYGCGVCMFFPYCVGTLVSKVMQ